MDLQEIERILSSNDESTVTELIADCHRGEHSQTGYALGQYFLNRNYAEEAEGHILAGGISQRTSDGVQYVLHEYCQPESEECRQFVMEHPGPNNAYWPHFSLRPSTIKMEAWRRTGDFREDAGHFEIDYARRYVDAGYRSCFFNTVYCFHIGK